MPLHDYPAAHSMDTEWFAVDACGHVGLFSTGEAGGVPDGALATRGATEDFIAALGAALPRVDTMPVPSKFATHFAHGEAMRYFLPPSVVDELVASTRSVRREPSSPEAAIYGELDWSTHARLHADGLCLGCGPSLEELDDDEDWTLQGGESATRRGLFAFGHSDAAENWIAGPYNLEAVPAHPVVVGDLPRELAAAVAGVKLPGCFYDISRIQPAEHVPCFTWDPAWIDADMKHVHAEPSRMSDYAEFLRNAAGTWREGITFDEVAGERSRGEAPGASTARREGLLARLLRRLLRS